MKRKDLLNVLFWIFLIIGITLLLWRIFGNSPTDLTIILPFILMLLFKMWSMNDDLKDFKHEVQFSFHKVREDINNLKYPLKNKKWK